MITAPLALFLCTGFPAAGVRVDSDISMMISLYKVAPQFEFAETKVKTTKSGVIYAVAKQESAGKMLQALLDNRRVSILGSARKRVASGKSATAVFPPTRGESETYTITATLMAGNIVFSAVPSAPADTEIKVTVKPDEALLFIQPANKQYPRRLLIIAPELVALDR